MGCLFCFFASCCFQIIVNLKECFYLWLLLGDRNSLENSYDEEAFNGNSQFYLLEHLKKSPGNICKLFDTDSPPTPTHRHLPIPPLTPHPAPGQASQSLESDSTPRRHNKVLTYSRWFDEMNLCRTVGSQYQHLGVYTG